MARFSLEETPPPGRGRPRYPKNRDKDPAAYDAAKQYAIDAAVREEVMKLENMAYHREKEAKNEEAAKKLNRRKSVVMSHLEDSAESTPITAQEYKQAQDTQRQEALDKLNDYKKGIKATATAAELLLSGGSLLGAYANWRNWANATNATKKVIANILQKAQFPMQAGGLGIDLYQTLDAYNNEDKYNLYYNGVSSGLGLAGTLGAADVFRGRYPMVDRTLDVLGVLQNSGDYLKFLYDTVNSEDYK